MTAEIAILNKQAVALAADSAITYGPKIYNTANKLFMLSPVAPIGIMIYNNAEFMGIPWETLIKYYRNHVLKNTTYDNLNTYVYKFIEFIHTNKDLFPNKRQQEEYKRIVDNKLENIQKHVYKNIEATFRKKKKEEKINEAQIKTIVIETIEKIHNLLKGLDNLPGVSKADISKINKMYGQYIKDQIDSFFGELDISRAVKKKLEQICVYLVTKGYLSNYSGIVISGFGEKEIFPSLYYFNAINKLGGKFFHSKVKEIIVDYENGAYIKPFAQAEMPITFMEGIDPRQRDHLRKTIQDKILKSYNESVINTISDELSRKNINNFDVNGMNDKLAKFTTDIIIELERNWELYRLKNHAYPVMEAVAALPKDELASMAESLVNLTSLKRKMSVNQKETVGGPIDVAVISKADGLIWINRKHYFKPELNYSFFDRNRKTN